MLNPRKASAEQFLFPHTDGGIPKEIALRVVVCGENPLIRRRLTQVAEEQGCSVLAETAMAFEASEVAERFGADVLILDLSVPLALGKHPIDDLERPGRTYHVLIACDRPAEIDPARPRLTVVSRHHLEGMANALARLGDARGTERRRGPDRPRHSVPGARNLCSTHVFFEALNTAVPGDVLLMLTVRDGDALDRLASLCSSLLRETDFVLRQSSEVVALLPGGDDGGRDPALERIVARWPDAGALVVRRIVVSDVPPSALYTSELRALRDDHRQVEVFS
jgi:CheY-like chemotaxis protein